MNKKEWMLIRINLNPDKLIVEIDVIENATDSLSRAIDFAAQAHRDPYAWKWVCIAIHGAARHTPFTLCQTRSLGLEKGAAHRKQRHSSYSSIPESLLTEADSGV